MKLIEEVAHILYGMDQDSIETPLEDASQLVRDDIYDTADQILALPRIASALRFVEGLPGC